MANMRVLVTGAGGFIGSHLAERLVQEGHQVRAFVQYNSRNHLGWLEGSPHLKDIEVVTGDVRDYDCVFNAIRRADAVFHLAALIGIPYSYVSPLAYIRTNVEGTYNVLQSCRSTDCSNVLITSTSETYGTAQLIPINEDHPLVGQSPYSATKIGADQLSISFYRSFGMPVKIVRPFNTFGPRQSARAIIPTIISQLLSGQRELKLGNLTPTRDFTYVADTVDGFLAIARCQECIGQVVNIGTGTEISIEDLARLIARLLRMNVRFTTEDKRVRPSTSEVERLVCDNSKIRRLTGWTPQHIFEAGLQAFIDWARANLSHFKPEWYNI